MGEGWDRMSDGQDVCIVPLCREANSERIFAVFSTLGYISLVP